MVPFSVSVDIHLSINSIIAHEKGCATQQSTQIHTYKSIDISEDKVADAVGGLSFDKMHAERIISERSHPEGRNSRAQPLL